MGEGGIEGYFEELIGDSEDDLWFIHTLIGRRSVAMEDSLSVAFHNIQRISRWCRASNLAAHAKRANS